MCNVFRGYLSSPDKSKAVEVSPWYNGEGVRVRNRRRRVRTPVPL